MEKHRILSRLLPFLLLAYAFGILYLLIRLGMPIAHAQLIGSISFLCACLLLEISFPYRKDWAFWMDKQTLNDIFLYVINTFLLLNAGFILPIVQHILPIRLHVWPSHLPLWLQLIVAIYLYDFFYYWFHRLSHTLRPVWIFHAVHHSSEKLHFLKGSRSNFFMDVLPFSILTIYPLAFFHPPKEIFIALGYTLSIFSFLVHANISLDFPAWWERVLVSPKIHYMHHDKKMTNGIGYNFGSLTLLWDKIFGTYKQYTEPEKLFVGIENDPVSHNLFWQIFYPFKKNTLNPVKP